MALLRISGVCLATGFAAVSSAEAQPRLGWSTEFSAFIGYQGAADLDGGGEVSATRSFLRAGAIHSFSSGSSAGLALSFGQQDYDFGGAAAPLWGDVSGVAFSAPLQFEIADGPRILLAPQIRSRFESGAHGSDSTTFGLFAGASWQLNDSLRIGPAVGLFSELEGDGLDAFPALIVDWDIAERWKLRTGRGVAATRGPGLRLSYSYSDALDLGLGVRLESGEFRLDDTGPTPGGVGEDRSTPVVISMDYTPNPGFAVSGFIGAAFDGELRVEDSTGVGVTTQSYDTAPVGGLSLRLRF